MRDVPAVFDGERFHGRGIILQAIGSPQPEPPDPAWPRYSSRPFPAYRFVPGKAAVPPGAMPHPRRHPKGHSFGRPEPKPPAPAPENWSACDEYLFGIDCFNFAYWWECHEALESLWHAVGHKTPQGQFLQGIIQVAAANLKRFTGVGATAKELAFEGLDRLRGVSGIYMGVDTAAFDRDVREFYEGRRDRPALIRLALPAGVDRGCRL